MARLLVADDDPLTAAGIELLLKQSNHTIVAMARTGMEVLDNLASARPDILILDINMPERSGLEVLRTLRARGDNRSIILLTGNINDQNAKEAMELGVNGLVIKASAPRDLPICLDTVAQGRRWFDQEVMQRAMDLAHSSDAAKNPLEELTPRQRSIASLVQRGLKNRDVAEELGLTEGTVKVHLHKIFEKLGLRSRTELILLAAEQGD